MSSRSYRRSPPSPTFSAPLKSFPAQEHSKHLLRTYAQHRAYYQFLTYFLYYVGALFVALGVVLLFYCYSVFPSSG